MSAKQEAEPGQENQSNTSSSTSTQSKPLDKSVRDKISNRIKINFLESSILASSEIIKANKEEHTVIEELTKLYGDLETDKKYYVLIHSLYDCNILKYFKSKSNILKKVNFKIILISDSRERQ